MNQTKVAVIIVNYNSTALLHQCLRSLNRQTVQPDQIVVVDNGGQDLLPSDMEQQYPNIKFIRLEKNIGFAAANNLAVRTVQNFEWIALLNPDAFPEPNWLEALLKVAAENTAYDFFGSHMLSANTPEILDGIGDVYHVSGRAWREGIGKIAQKISHEMREIFSPCAAAALYKRDAFWEVNGFDENYFCYFEDVDLGFRLRLAGYKCLYVPQAIVHHVGSATTKKHSDFYVYYGQRNLVWTYIKDMPGFLFWFYLPQHLFLNLFSLLWFAMRGQFKIAIKAKWDACREIKRVWSMRRQIQKKRKVTAWQVRQHMAKGFPFQK